MKIIDNLKNVLKKGFSRFLFPLIWLFLTFASTICLIFGLPDEFFAYFTISAMLSVFLSLTFVLLYERLKPRKPFFHYILQVIPLISSFVFTFLLESESVYCFLAYIGLLASSVIGCVILLLGENNRHTLVPFVIKNLAMASLVAIIVFCGLLLCLAAVNYLICELDNFTDLLLCITSFSFCLVFGTFFISSVPEINSELTVPKAFRVIFLYAAFPIYILLLAVLYIYFVKIIFTQSIPGGQLNWFASFAEVFFILFNFTILQYDTKITRLWKKCGGYLLIPVIVFQAIAVFIRVSAYGLTAARWVSILLSLVATVFVILSVIKEGKYRNASLYVLLTVMLVSTLTPLSFIDVPTLEQNARLNSILERNGMKDGDVIVAKSDIPDEEKIAITESFDYLRYSDSIFVPDYIENLSAADFKSNFGFEMLYANEYRNKAPRKDYTYISYHSDLFDRDRVLDVSKYSGFTKVESYWNEDDFILEVLDKKYDLTAELGNFNEDPTGIFLVIERDGIDFYITDLSYQFYTENGKRIYNYISITAYAFLH